MLIGGADVSGCKADGQHNHVPLVIGKEDAINKIYNKIGISPIHMSEISKSQRRQVRDNLDFSSNEVIVWCFHVSRQRIENDMKECIAPRKKRSPSINVHKSFESYWFQTFREDLESFTRAFWVEQLTAIIIEADADMRSTLHQHSIFFLCCSSLIPFQKILNISTFHYGHVTGLPV